MSYPSGISGPSGSPNAIQSTSVSVLKRPNRIEYGSITEISVPMPISRTYFCANTMTRGKYGNNGVMMLVNESPTRYAACVSSGENPSNINIGTNIGASTAHLADTLPTNRLTNPVTITNPMTSGRPVKPIACNPLAPLIATMLPRFDQLKSAMKCAAANASTM